MFKIKIAIAIFGLTVSCVPSIALSQAVESQNTLEDGSQENYVGFMVEDDGYLLPIEKVILESTKYCPDKAPKQEVTFVSDSMPTASNRRVIITNVTQNENNNSIFGNNNTAPFTNREYDRDFISENIDLAIGSQHIDRKFIVSEGQNLLEYKIVEVKNENGRDPEKVLETGKFYLTVGKPKPPVLSSTPITPSLNYPDTQEDTQISREIRDSLEKNPLETADLYSYCDALKTQQQYEQENLFENTAPDFESLQQREREIIEDFKERNDRQYNNNDWMQPPTNLPQYDVNDWKKNLK